MVAVPVLLFAGCSGREPEEPEGTFFEGSPQNDDLAFGRLDAGRVAGITVYIHPPGLIVASRHEDLARCAKVTVEGEEAVRELLGAIATKQPTVRDSGKSLSLGKIEVVLHDGQRLYLSYEMWENNVWVGAPYHEGRPVTEGVSNYVRALGPWLRRYVYGPRSPPSSSSTSTTA
jgi:hypothetical protein